MDLIRKLLMKLMKQKGFALTVPLIIIGVLALVGVGTALYTKTQDGPIEEEMEEAIEDTLETTLGLPNDALDGKIDLTPGSSEKTRT